MHGHEAELLTTTLLMLSAIVCGLILKFVRQPPLVGYILAGPLCRRLLPHKSASSALY
jgi:Kef-type K+ transport system membrane component KefB